MLSAYDLPETDKPQLSREDLKTMRPQDIVKAREEGRLRDITSTGEQQRRFQGKDHR